ncbi:MAG: hypothetical protein H7099_08270 [Gemmatimonadaceae bacterium]|nr:hypothetical protein [Gemmatimonadaceae bacterium]
MSAVTSVRPVPDEVQVFLDAVVAWPTERWRRCVVDERRRVSAESRATARELRDAVLAAEGLAMLAWFTTDAAETSAGIVQSALAPADHLLVTTLLTDAALAILARPALPTRDLALLLTPFLPLQLP